MTRKTFGAVAYNAMEARALKAEALAREAGEIIKRIGHPVGNEEMWLKRDFLAKLESAGLLPASHEEVRPAGSQRSPKANLEGEDA